jgi:hypothetical protein
MCNTQASNLSVALALQPRFRGQLVGIRVRTQLLAATLGGVVLCGFAAPRTASFSSILPSSDQESSVSPRELSIDLYGNEVSQAVERYKVDFLGEWYEEHSPDTEVPKLSPPQG